MGDVLWSSGTRNRVRTRNLRRDPRMSLCIEDGMRYVTLEGWAELIEDRAQQEREVNQLIAPRYIGQRLGEQREAEFQRVERQCVQAREVRFQAVALAADVANRQREFERQFALNIGTPLRRAARLEVGVEEIYVGRADELAVRIELRR